MSQPYNPLEHSIVQAITGSRHETYEASDFQIALLYDIARTIKRVHMNRYQSTWDRWSDDPHIPGIEWRSFRYGDECECPEAQDGSGDGPNHLEDCRAIKPNFEFDGVCFSWYKYPGRGTSVNVRMEAAQWVDWFNRCRAKIEEFDIVALEHGGAPLPKSTHFYLGICHILHSSDWRGSLARYTGHVLEHLVKAEASFQDKDFDALLANNPDQHQLILKAVCLGIQAEKERAFREDR